MTRYAVMACVLAGVAGAAQAATVEFRLVERRGQTQWNTSQPTGVPLNDSVLNFSVQARVVGGAAGEGLGNFGFDVVSSDSEGAGTLAKAYISNSDGTYGFTTYSNVATVGRGGLAGQYAYLAGINPNFNGLINASGGSFTNNAALGDIGLVTGSPTGNSLLLVTDTDFDGNPDTYPGTGSSAALDAAVASQYFGSDGNWIPVYNFNYTVTDTTSRTITFGLLNANAQTFSSLALANGVWGPANPTNAQASSGSISISIIPAPGAAALLGLGGLVAARRRRTA